MVPSEPMAGDVDGRDKVSQKWSFKNEPPG
jgi:hypothetical protein